ncbi:MULTISPECIES: HsdR family type I site-specific deoxyribonuclease [unclassified Paraflavitalea]|uniref:HsdR family type I site-specific deoxyribonuclease n=1 Tax=unclassified Paraflavitalea TaxID=2798305 RepID=UPI003D32E4F7
MTENTIETFSIELLTQLGYEYIYAPSIAPVQAGEWEDTDGASGADTRESFEQVLLLHRLEEAVKRINPSIPAAVQAEAIKEIQRIASPELLTNNETFHRFLTEGVPVTKRVEGDDRGDRVWLVDFKNPLNNDFVVANQFTIIENGNNKRPDILLFVNGIPLVVIELKNATDENTTTFSAYKQLDTYKSIIPSLFTYNGFLVISDGLEAKAGNLSSGFSRFMSWKSADGKAEASHLVSQLETLIKGMLNKRTLLDLIRHFIVFEKSKKEDSQTGITSIHTVKKIAAYHQYYAVNRAVESTLRAAGYMPPQARLFNSPTQQLPPQAGLFNSPPLEGWPQAGVVPPAPGKTPPHRASKNYFALPYNPQLKERARALRQAGNLPEVLFWNQVKNKQFKGLDFDRQKIIGNYIVDFYCPNCGVVIEIDGSSHDDKQEYDAARDKYLESLHLTVIHIPVEQIMKTLGAVMSYLEGHEAFQKQWVIEEMDLPYETGGSTEENTDHPALSGTPPKENTNHPALSGTPPKENTNHPALTGTPPKEGNGREFDLGEDPVSYGLPAVSSQPVGDRKGGVVWHTQGSGKSLSMVFYTGKIVLALDNPTVLVITDRNDLDDQLFDTFAASKQLLRQEPVQAEDRYQLKELLKVASGGVIFTTIQKFQPEEGNVYELLSDRKNIVVIADEAHRTQYGFRAKTVDAKDENGNVIGKKVVYGFAKYMRDALPNATYLGFTGTPIENTDVNTPAVFGNYVDIYDIAQAVEDGATVRIYYESRLAKVNLSEEGRQLVDELDDELEQEELTNTQKAKAKWTQLEALVGSENRIQNIAKDIVTHFTQRQEAFEGKGMIVSMSRRIAVELYNAIIAIKPEWHSNDLTKGVIKVVMTAASSDGPVIAKHHTTKDQRRMLAERMKNPDDELKLVIVRDMWLTGFDAPSMHTLYIDKPMKGHNLMQAIARVNRVYKDKPGGLIVDYLGIAADLKKALSFYSDAGGKGDPTEQQEQAVSLMREKLEVVSNMFHGFAYEDYFDADTSKKLSLILSAEEHILGLEDGKKRYINEVTALSKAFAIAIPHDEAMDAKDEIAFFQAVKARLAKFDATGTGRTDEEIETTIRQVIDKALVSEKVIDIFDAAGIKKPDISILSEEFLMEIRGMERKNLALEVLKKLLNDEIKSRAKKNLIQSRTFLEMLENSIKKYHNKILTAAEVIEELINLSKDIVKGDEEAKQMGLTDFEYAFYTAVANNDSARELMQKDKLRELAVVLTETIRQNASIDWTIKESVKAKLRVAVKRLLRKYGYPPDMQMLATDTVLKQAELIANEVSGVN